MKENKYKYESPDERIERFMQLVEADKERRLKAEYEAEIRMDQEVRKDEGVWIPTERRSRGEKRWKRLKTKNQQKQCFQKICLLSTQNISRDVVTDVRLMK